MKGFDPSRLPLSKNQRSSYRTTLPQSFLGILTHWEGYFRANDLHMIEPTNADVAAALFGKRIIVGRWKETAAMLRGRFSPVNQPAHDVGERTCDRLLVHSVLT